MKSLLKQSLIFIYSSTFLTACATTGSTPKAPQDIDERGSDCISIRTIRDYRPLDRSSLIIEGAGKRLYYVTLMTSSFELKGSHQVGVNSRDEWLCPYGGDTLIFQGFDTTGIGIRGISRLTDEQADELLYRYGKKERPSQPGETPPELGGADVEEIGETPEEQTDPVPPRR